MSINLAIKMAYHGSPSPSFTGLPQGERDTAFRAARDQRIEAEKLKVRQWWFLYVFVTWENGRKIGI